MHSISAQLIVAVVLVAALAFATELGFRLGQSVRLRLLRKREDAKPSGQVGALQGAMLGLLALLLGFSFAGASARFLERQDNLVAEANALGTLRLRTDLLDEPHRAAMHAVLDRYIEARIRMFDAPRPEEAADIARSMEAMQAELWSSALAGIDTKPSVMMAVLPPINEVIDLHGKRSHLSRRHLPTLVVGLLIASAVLGTLSVGFGNGILGDRHLFLSSSLVLLVGIALWTTIDLDHPKYGFVQLDGTPLYALTRPPS
jgi:hypothetical protein